MFRSSPRLLSSLGWVVEPGGLFDPVHGLSLQNLQGPAGEGRGIRRRGASGGQAAAPRRTLGDLSHLLRTSDFPGGNGKRGRRVLWQRGRHELGLWRVGLRERGSEYGPMRAPAPPAPTGAATGSGAAKKGARGTTATYLIQPASASASRRGASSALSSDAPTACTCAGSPVAEQVHAAGAPPLGLPPYE